MFRPFPFSLVFLAATGVSPAADPAVPRADLGDVTGTVVKAGPGSITLKVPTVAQTGVSRKHVGGRHGPTVTVPRYETKQVETTYALAPDVVVKTLAGKSATLEEVRPGEPSRLHVYRVTERTPASGRRAGSRCGGLTSPDHPPSSRPAGPAPSRIKFAHHPGRL